jgi:hypothetical protein
MLEWGIEMVPLFLCSACTLLKSLASGLFKLSDFSLLLEHPVESLELVSEEAAFAFIFLLLS